MAPQAHVQALQRTLDLTEVDPRAFLFDLDGNQKLEFDEFLAIQPRAIRERFSAAQIESWFERADTSGDRTLSLNEFFIWALANASEQFGASALGIAFEKYDLNGSGTLDNVEFQHACQDLGFGTWADNIFKALDVDRSGTLSYSELVRPLTTTLPVDADAKAFLTALVCSLNAASEEEGAKAVLDTSEWRILGTDTLQIKSELQTLALRSGGHVADIITLFCDSSSSPDLTRLDLIKIDESDFIRCLRTSFGYRGPGRLLLELFDALDTDGSGCVGFQELYEFIRGKRHRLDQRRRLSSNDMRLVPAEGTVPVGTRLDDLAWDASVLRSLLREMLKRCQPAAGAEELIRSWNGTRRGLSRSEFIGCRCRVPRIAHRCLLSPAPALCMHHQLS